MEAAWHEELSLCHERQVAALDKPAELQWESVEPAAIERPVAYRPAVEVKEPRAGIPADAAAKHRARRLHRLLVAAVEPDVERPAIDVLAVIGDAKGRLCQHRVGLARAVGGQDRRFCRAHGIHDAGEKIEDADIDRDRLARMMVAQKYR